VRPLVDVAAAMCPSEFMQIMPIVSWFDSVTFKCESSYSVAVDFAGATGV